MAFFFDSNDKDTEETSSPVAFHEPVEEFHHFRERLHQEVLRSQRKEHAFTVMRIALEPDRKTLAHDEMKRTLKATIREYDLLCSMNAGDYALVFPETGEQFADRIAARIRGEMVKSRPQSFELLTDIGIACFPQDGANADDLLDSAEQDLRSQRKRRHH